MSDKINGQREAAMDFFQAWLKVVTQRSFERQIRSEECGVCMADWSHEFYLTLSDQLEKGHLYLSELLRKVTCFLHLPRHTLKVLESITILMKVQAERGGLSENPYHKCLAGAVEELTSNAANALDAGHHLLFCRIAQPLNQIGQTYADLCNKAKIPPTESKFITECFNEISNRIDQLATQQGKDPDKWIEQGRKKLKYVKAKPGFKRIWSGGECRLFDQGKPRKLPTMKILHFTHKSMTVHSREPLEDDCTYTCLVDFNFIDLAFVSNVTVRAKRESVELIGHNREISDECKAPNYYVLKFTGKPDDPHPVPHYYFLSMCRDLCEQHTTWAAPMFIESLCSDYWAKATLPKGIVNV